MLYIWAGSLIYKFMCVYVWSLTPVLPSHFPSHTCAHNKHTHKHERERERETQVAEPTCGTCQHPTKLISYLLLLLGDCLCDNPKESREGREGIKSNLAPVTGSILKVISVFVCKSDIKHVGLNMRVCVCECSTLVRYSRENWVYGVHWYAKVMEHCEYGCGSKWVSSILCSASICPSTKKPLESTRMGESIF